ncbi:MAG: hypothetical protein ACRCZU_09135, partial [Selenomonadaceae bacterium]
YVMCDDVHRRARASRAFVVKKWINVNFFRIGQSAKPHQADAVGGKGKKAPGNAPVNKDKINKRKFFSCWAKKLPLTIYK